MTWSDKTSLFAQKYTHAYNGVYLLFCRCYSNSVSFIELLRMFASYMVKFELKYCVQNDLLNLKDSKLTQNFYGNKTSFVRSGHICRIPFSVSLLTQTVVKQWFSYMKNFYLLDCIQCSYICISLSHTMHTVLCVK